MYLQEIPSSLQDFTFSTVFTLTMSQLIKDQYAGYPNIKTKNLATTLIFIFQFDKFLKDAAAAPVVFTHQTQQVKYKNKTI